MTMWQNLNHFKGPDSDPAYSVLRLAGACMWSEPDGTGMQALRLLFPDGAANEMSFVLFSTSGTHGSYRTIEEVEAILCGKPPAADEDTVTARRLTFLVVQPRLVCLRYGVCYPENQDDIDWLKAMRASSHTAIAQIGI